MDPLISVSDVPLDHADVRIVDVRWYLADLEQGHREYLTSHIAGAIYFDVETDLSARTGPGRHPLPDPETFAATLGQAGIGNRHHVIAYDSSGGAIAARLWWMLRHLGHDRVQVLDGGWDAWIESSRPVTDVVPTFSAETFAYKVRSDDTIDANELAARLGEVAVIDARAGERYRGETEPVDPVAGHIPTAINHPHTTNVDAAGHFLPPAALRERYATDEEVVAYCGSGVTSCSTLIAHVIAGLPEPKLYPGSWSDWSSSGRAVATGPEPGEAP